MIRWTEEEYELYMKKNKKEKKESTKSRYNKYKNKKIEIDGHIFDSKKEADYYIKLCGLKQAGEIKDFELQPKFELQPSFINNKGEKIKAITYIADFKIYHNDGSIEIVDVKGFKTKEFKIKKKIFEYRYKDYVLTLV